MKPNSGVTARWNRIARSLRISKWSAWWCAVLAAGAVFSYQALVVHYHYGGNWTGLFCIGSLQRLPPELASGVYRFPNSYGYDAQFYRIMAHDPFLRKGYASAIDDAPLRYRRILAPALSWALVFGRQNWVDYAYIAVILSFVFFGTYWLSRASELLGYNSALGLYFLFAPSTLAGADRLLLDVATAAWAAGLAFFWLGGSFAGVWICLAAACLTRETGVLLVLPCVVFLLQRRQFSKAFLLGLTLLPAAGWFAYVHRATAAASPVPSWFGKAFRLGVFERLYAVISSVSMDSIISVGGAVLEVLALSGMLYCFAVAALAFRLRPRSPVSWCLLAQVLLAALVDVPGFWISVVGYSRVFGPLFVFLFWYTLEERKFGAGGGLLAATAAVDLRFLSTWGMQILSVLRGVLSR